VIELLEQEIKALEASETASQVTLQILRSLLDKARQLKPSVFDEP